MRGALAGGAQIIQLREKAIGDRLLLQRARALRRWTAEAGALFIMNDRPDLALLSDADGVHVGQDELSVAHVRQILGAARLVGVSTHSPEQARDAVSHGADYIGIGPVFASQTKRFQRLAGLSLLHAVQGTPIPAFAIGGINETNLADVLRAGATRIAVSAAVCGADDPAAAARRLLAAMKMAGAEPAQREGGRADSVGGNRPR